ncbi:hypothetical protein PR202_ga00418 [Eleusine coracana subsp. coracana]|uniref:Exostosin GT47 domain-containing protein n=1 Tax=Eleusine coracana subsp. coracana TaxID=191504 RepID=A0AAV5BCJ7_ELECO|nr:hypothetical protein QOZ80_2AG0126870 [Eleusine coracana subsp. coracana]GJM84721.1 hypothetical protein PR202_ga00418 [Eleusine coracana subsp. coracana]
MKLGGFDVDIQKDAVDGGSGVLRPSRICYLAMISTTFWALVFFLPSSTQGGDGIASVLFKPSTFSIPLFSSVATVPAGAPPASATVLPEAGKEDRSVTADDDRCAGRYIYMYDLPPRFNSDLLADCGKLDIWMDMCPYVANHGMGQALGDEAGAFSDRGWYATNQFMLDVIFHGRMKAYDCLTSDPARAAAAFVPFYASLDGGRYMWNSTSLRDALALEFLEWLTRRPAWRAAGGGRGHFFVAGRTAVDFTRKSGGNGWGTSLLRNPTVQNMTVLVLETVAWSRSNVAVPYPTYFHPEAAADVAAWQDRVQKAERKWLFSFAGAPRPGNSRTVRAQIIQQCGASGRCSLYRCGGAGAKANCYSPGGVMRLMESSTFCLEPRGDSLTRRSTFDAILAGCIPVFFHPGSAYTQYTLHLPKDPNKYSVLIMHTDITERNVSIEDTLSRISPETVKAMREEVIQLIPRVVYADPRSRRVDFKDAFDVAVEAVIDRVASRRRGASAGTEH